MAIEYKGYEKESVNICGIKFAPLWIPLKRRWETCCILLLLILGPFLFFLTPLICVYIIFYPSMILFLLPYIVWYVYDKETPDTGGRKSCFIKNYVTSISDYFPAKMVKTVDLPANSNYLFGLFPHGVISCGMLSNFIVDRNFKETFPELECKPILLDVLLKMPITREGLLSIGLSSSSGKNIHCLLTSENKNNAVILEVGGAAECMLAVPGTNKIIINGRKGFVKLALKSGASLVPAYTFGENELYDQVQNETIQKIQIFVRKWIGVTLVCMKGRGIFQYSFGILPRRRPVTSVVGKPIAVPKCENPTEEQINEYHTKFKEELISLFNCNKEKYDINGKNAELICV